MEIKIEIRSIIKPDEMRKTEDLQRLIWPGADRDIVPDHMLLAVARNGGIVLGAFDQDHLVGFVLGFLGTDSETASELAMTRFLAFIRSIATWASDINSSLHSASWSCARACVLSHGRMTRFRAGMDT